MLVTMWHAAKRATSWGSLQAVLLVCSAQPTSLQWMKLTRTQIATHLTCSMALTFTCTASKVVRVYRAKLQARRWQPSLLQRLLRPTRNCTCRLVACSTCASRRAAPEEAIKSCWRRRAIRRGQMAWESPPTFPNRRCRDRVARMLFRDQRSSQAQTSRTPPCTQRSTPPSTPRTRRTATRRRATKTTSTCLRRSCASRRSTAPSGRSCRWTCRPSPRASPRDVLR
mmetsp:Transcript_22371/g.48826  ORF Transcript_22371/g.48826 Transcript_22371/m.48826 type:complete len:226 (+) Transcript_22371:305-982(+)